MSHKIHMPSLPLVSALFGTAIPTAFSLTVTPHALGRARLPHDGVLIRVGSHGKLLIVVHVHALGRSLAPFSRGAYRLLMKTVT